jgi:hypothetical protein
LGRLGILLEIAQMDQEGRIVLLNRGRNDRFDDGNLVTLIRKVADDWETEILARAGFAGKHDAYQRAYDDNDPGRGIGHVRISNKLPSSTSQRHRISAPRSNHDVISIPQIGVCGRK